MDIVQHFTERAKSLLPKNSTFDGECWLDYGSEKIFTWLLTPTTVRNSPIRRKQTT